MEELLKNEEYRRELISAIAKEVAAALKPPVFDGGRVPITEAAAIMRKNRVAVRKGIESGRLPIGCALDGEKDNNTYYISPKLFYEYTGHIWKGDVYEKQDPCSD